MLLPQQCLGGSEIKTKQEGGSDIITNDPVSSSPFTHYVCLIDIGIIPTIGTSRAISPSPRGSTSDRRCMSVSRLLSGVVKSLSNITPSLVVHHVPKDHLKCIGDRYEVCFRAQFETVRITWTTVRIVTVDSLDYERTSPAQVAFNGWIGKVPSSQSHSEVVGVALPSLAYMCFTSGRVPHFDFRRFYQPITDLDRNPKF